MQTMSYRTTFALDRATADRLKRLASVWQVSQAEVVRRAVAQAEAQSTPANPDPVAMLRELHDSGQGLDPKTARAYMVEVREERRRCEGFCGRLSASVSPRRSRQPG
jgi:hypothetical protein